MNSHDLIQLGAKIATQGNQLLLSNRSISMESIQSFWIHSKCRITHWNLAMKQVREKGVGESSDPPILEPTLTEVLCAELLQRVWSAVVQTYGSAALDASCDPLIENLAQSQSDATNRLFSLLNERLLPGKSAETLVRIQRRVERWTDLLLAELSVTCAIEPFAFDVDRVYEFHGDLYRSRGRSTEDTWKLLLRSLDRAFQMPQATVTQHGPLNRKLAESIWTWLEHDPYETRFATDPYWLEQLAHSGEQAQILVDELLDNTDREF